MLSTALWDMHVSTTRNPTAMAVGMNIGYDTKPIFTMAANHVNDSWRLQLGLRVSGIGK